MLRVLRPLRVISKNEGLRVSSIINNLDINQGFI